MHWIRIHLYRMLRHQYQARNQYRWRLIIKHPKIKVLANIFEWIYDKYSVSGKRQWAVSMDINPYSML